MIQQLLRSPLLRLTLPIGAAWFLVALTLFIAQPPRPTVAESTWQEVVARQGQARVQIVLNVPAGRALADIQASLLAQLPPDHFTLLHRYQFVAGLAGLITPAGAAILRQSPYVSQIYLDRPGQGHLAEIGPAVGADQIQAQYGLTGQGVFVATLDTGIDSDHPDLAGAIVAQHCFTDGDCPPNNSNEGDSAEDDHGHGTNIAGAITADGLTSPLGIAPNANLVVVRVLDSNNSGWVSDWVAGLDWVRANLGNWPVKVVNMSLGTFALYSGSCNVQEPLLAAAISQLRNLGVTILASSGNQGSANAITAPACNGGVIGVAATYDSDLGREPDSGTYQTLFGGSWPACFDDQTALQLVTCFSNSNSSVDILAPGARLTSAGLGGGAFTFRGTSQATAVASGLTALLLELNPFLTPTEIEIGLESTGLPLVDPKNGLTFPLVDGLAAVQALFPVAPAGITLTHPLTGSVGWPVTIGAVVRPPTTTLPLTYRWLAAGWPVISQTAGLSTTLDLSWETAGSYPISLTVGNWVGSVTATTTISQVWVGPTDLALSGPTYGSTGHPLTFTALVAPIQTSRPVTYSWSPAGIIHTAGLSDVLALSWSQPGTYPVNVTAHNPAGTVSMTRPVTITIVGPITATLSGAGLVPAGLPYPITATVSPITASWPITYVWQATHQQPISHTAQSSDTAIFTWLDPGLVTITLTIKNQGGMMLLQKVIQVVPNYYLYLPIILSPH